MNLELQLGYVTDIDNWILWRKHESFRRITVAVLTSIHIHIVQFVKLEVWELSAEVERRRRENSGAAGAEEGGV